MNVRLTVKTIFSVLIAYMVDIFNEVYPIIGNYIVGGQLESSDFNYLLLQYYKEVDTLFYALIIMLLIMVWYREIKYLHDNYWVAEKETATE